MTNAITNTTDTKLNCWENKENLIAIKNIYGKSLSDPEWNIFLEIGKSTGLNPFLREIWAVKYGNAEAQIFIGRDGYRTAAVGTPDYDGHVVGSVYENDDYSVDRGHVTHKYNMTNRGKLIGAYCSVYRKSISIPSHVFVLLSEYNTGKSVWSGKPETMIKKVAEAQAFRMSNPSKFNGTYSEYEMWNEKQNQATMRVVKEETQYASKADQIAASMEETIEVMPQQESNDLQLRIENGLNAIYALGGDDRDVCATAHVDSIEELESDEHLESLLILHKRLKTKQ